MNTIKKIASWAAAFAIGILWFGVIYFICLIS